MLPIGSPDEVDDEDEADDEVDEHEGPLIASVAMAPFWFSMTVLEAPFDVLVLRLPGGGEVSKSTTLSSDRLYSSFIYFFMSLSVNITRI